MEDVNAIFAIRDISRAATLPRTEETIHYVVAPKDSQLLSLKDMQYPHGLPPERIVANVSLQDASSFCSYVNTFKDDRTRILANANADSLSFLALLDYHGVGAERKPEFVSHRAALRLKLSEEWKLWYGYHDKLVPQAEFAEFLEDNRADVVSPDSATMLEVAKDLQAHSEVNFSSKIRTQNGQATLSYEENIQAKVANGTVEIPEVFTIRIPVFFGESAIDTNARLRFRIKESKLNFQYKLYRPAEVISKAFNVARKEIAEATSLEVLLGTI